MESEVWRKENVQTEQSVSLFFCLKTFFLPLYTKTFVFVYVPIMILHKIYFWHILNEVYITLQIQNTEVVME